MNIETQVDADMDEEKTLKVTIPKRMHLKLHSVKILTGRNISETVEEAVQAFFDEHEELPDGLLG